MRSIETFIALNRFGLGVGPHDARRVGGDPRRWLLAQIDSRQRTPARLERFPDSASIVKDIFEARRSGSEALRKTTRKHYRRNFGAELVARARHAITTDTPFAERLVLFWSNHFTVSRTKAIIGPALPAYEREAVRPHVFGRFEDMLLAAVGHVAMLAYLDNDRSMGPNSRAGRRAKRSLNENLAREILELHTLGVDGGYRQNDVTEFAKALTGWTHGGMVGRRSRRTISGKFQFRAAMHEPGSKRVLGRTYPEAGEEEARRIMRDLVRHPSTARFIATKLVRHFVADDPPPGDVARIARVFSDSSGDLASVSRALVELPSVWEAPLAKVKTPYELVISTLRAVDHGKAGFRVLRVPLQTMGHEPFNAPSPQGWPDRAEHWIAPQALLRRVEWLRAVAAKARVEQSPSAFLESLAGPAASAPTRRMVALAPSADAGVALVLASAEFQRR
ncbi:MAG: DUF1800 domain-containing protein [Pseudomonadota bacterium]